MFEEMRSYLHVQTTRGRSRDTVLWMRPCLFGLYTIVVWLYAEWPGRWSRIRLVDWKGKREVTFSDAITAVRRWLWLEWVLATLGHRDTFGKLKPGLRQILLNGLAPAA
jgi:hypothetical protein